MLISLERQNRASHASKYAFVARTSGPGGTDVGIRTTTHTES